MRDPNFRFMAFRWNSGGPRRPLSDKQRLMTLGVRWLMLAVSVWVAAEIVSGIRLEGVWSTLAVAAILGLLNLYLRPLLVMVSLPVTVLTLGFFVIVINAALLGLTDWLADAFDLRFDVDGIGAALLGAVIISLVNMVLGMFIRPGRI